MEPANAPETARQEGDAEGRISGEEAVEAVSGEEAGREEIPAEVHEAFRKLEHLQGCRDRLRRFRDSCESGGIITASPGHADIVRDAQYGHLYGIRPPEIDCP